MRSHKTLSALLVALAFALPLALPAHAATLRFVGVSGVSDGAYYVGLQTISVDGVNYQAMCYDFARGVTIGQTWQANLLTIDDLSSGYYSGQPDYETKYRAAAWLLMELMKEPDRNAWIGIQHAAWLQFAPGAPTAGAAPYLAALSAARQSGYPGVDFSTVRFIEAVAGASAVQGLIAGGFPSSATLAPEPSTLATALTGFALLILGPRLKRAVRR